MSFKEIIETLLKEAPVLGTFSVPDMLRSARTDTINGIAAFHDRDTDIFLIIINGEPEGASCIDQKGELFGDKAVMMISGKEKFTLYEVKKEFVDAVAMYCRIFDKSHLSANTCAVIPEFGKKSSGVGNLTLIVQRDGEPQNGIRVSIRKDGIVVGSDITTTDGSVGFRAMHGVYDCVLQDRSQMITTRRITFDDANPRIILTI